MNGLIPADSNVPVQKDIRTLPRSVQQLFEGGAANLAAAAIDISSVPAHFRDQVRAAAASKIQETLLQGHFNDLRGANDLLKALDIHEIALSDEVTSKLNQLLPRITENALGSLGRSQPAVVGEYDLEKAKRILHSCGFTEEELDDEAVKLILDYRHMLMALKERSIKRIEMEQLLGYSPPRIPE